MAEDVQRIITKILAEMLDTQGISIIPTADMSLIDSGLLDSLSIVTFVGALESAFKIEITMADVTLDNFDRIDAICALVDSKRI